MRIAFLGDSLTEGWPGAAFFLLLMRRLPWHDLVNCGCAGDTVSDLRTRMRSEGLERVDLAFVWVGVNDALLDAWDADEDRNGGISSMRLARLRDDYAALVEWTEARAARLVLVRPLILDGDGSLWEERAAEIGDAIAELAAAHGSCRTLDLRPSFAGARAAGGGPFTIDGVHFTDAGADVVATAFAGVIAELAADARGDAGDGPSSGD